MNPDQKVIREKMLVYESNTFAVVSWNSSKWVNITERENLCSIAQLKEIGEVSAKNTTEEKVWKFQTGIGWVTSNISLMDTDNQVRY